MRAMKNKKLTQKLLKKTGFFLKPFFGLPFVRAVFLNGSLAIGQATESSDIDILVVAKSGRIFTVRFLVNTLLSILGVKRSSNERKNHAGKFCSNHFLTEEYLRIPTGRGERIDQYCADCHGNSVFVLGHREIFGQFKQINISLFKQKRIKIKDEQSELLAQYFPLPNNHFCLAHAKFAEKLLGGKVGDRFEQFIKKVQIRRIERDPRTKKYPDLICYNDRELRFHPPKS